MANMQEQFAILRAFLFKPSRFFNVIKTWLGYTVTKISGKTKVWGLPATAMIEPTTACNLGCPHCPSGLKSFTRDTGRIKPEAFRKIISQIDSHVGYLTLYFQGEPYLNPQFTELVKIANQHGIFTVTSSNAHFLNPENAKKTVLSGLKKIIISIDGTTQESYAHYRINGSLQTVLDGTNNLVKCKQELNSNFPVIYWQFIVFQHNEKELNEIKKLSKEYGVNHLQIKTAQIYDFDNAEKWLPQQEELRRYEKRNNKIQIKNKLLNHCWRLWSSTVITWDGHVVPCCFDKDANYQFGNVLIDNFKTIWKNEQANIFRQKLTKSRAEIDICTNCSEGTKIWD